MKKIGIMQPYFLPYIGYFQLIGMVDEFVIYDSIEYSKGGWIKRNRMLQNGEAVYFSLPIKKDSDYLDVDQRYLASNFEKQNQRLIRRIEANYKKTPQFENFFPLIKDILEYEEKNLFQYILNSVKSICSYLEIKTPIFAFSNLGGEIHKLKAQDKVISACKALNATHYINSSGGTHLYDKSDFKSENIELLFYQSEYITYPQFKNDFVPFLSILDVCMFNDKIKVQEYLKMYKLF